MKPMSPTQKAVVVAFCAANPIEDGELTHLREMAEHGRIAAADAQKALAEAWVRERDAELEVKRAKEARRRLQDRVRNADMQRHRLCAELDMAEWRADQQRLDEQAERLAG